jgi:hypothetical protein
MRTTRVLLLAVLAVTAAAVGSAADTKAEKQAKKAALLKKAAPAPTPAAKPPAAADLAPPLKPALVGGTKDAAAVARLIDAEIDRRLAAEKVAPSPAATDAEFLRRLTLDLTGVVPTADRAAAFLDSAAPDKRAKLIDELLASPGYGHRQADVWAGLLVRKDSDSRRVDFSSFREWLADQFNRNRPWGELASDVLTAAGPQDKNPAVGFYLSNNDVDQMTDEVCRLFLGVQLQCAQCHNHPFTGWKQAEYWGMAQFFYKVQVSGLNTAKGQTPTAEETNRPRRGKNALPDSAKAVPAKFLQGPSPTLSPAQPYRPTLAKWVTSPTNPFFAKAMVNRTWAGLFGRGLVDPVDDMAGAHEPSHPELLDALAADFAASGYDLKHLIRGICNSHAYQRSSKPTGGNEAADPSLFARAAVRVLAPEQLFDSLARVTGFDKQLTRQRDRKAVGGGGKGAGPDPRARFVEFYLAGADGPNPIGYDAGIPQALRLMNSRVANGPQAVREAVGTARGPAAVERLYLATVSRRPTPAEAKRIADYLAANGNGVEPYSDVLWALLNSSEFAFNR